MKGVFALTVCFVLLMAPTAFAKETEPGAIVGKWLTEKDQAVVEIYRDGDLYSGKIVWLKEPKYPDGTDKVDSSNPDESKRTRRIIGLQVVRNFKFDGNDKWSNGTAYDPNSGKTYSCNAKLKDDELYIRGFIGVSFFGKTTVWVRKAADSPE